MSFTSFIETCEARVKEIEAAAVSNAAAMQAHLAEAKHMLDLATKAAAAFAPTSEVTLGLEAVDKAVDMMADAVDSSAAQ